jgi:transcriptional regulator with XRE-family HTH domain
VCPPRFDPNRGDEALALRPGITRNVLIDVEHSRRSLLYERLYDIAEVLNLRISLTIAPNRHMG